MWRRLKLMEPIVRSTSRCLQLHLEHRGIQGHESKLSLPVPSFPYNILRVLLLTSFAWCTIIPVVEESAESLGDVRPHYLGCLRRLSD
jgi:hypothetical protein